MNHSSPTTAEPAARQLSLMITGPGGLKREHPLEIGRTVLVGGAANMSIELPHESVANLHCSLAAHPTGLIVRDWGSHSGTRVAGTVVESAAEVHPGDTIEIGPYRLTLMQSAATNELESTSCASGVPESRPTPELTDSQYEHSRDDGSDSLDEFYDPFADLDQLAEELSQNGQVLDPYQANPADIAVTNDSSQLTAPELPQRTDSSGLLQGEVDVLLDELACRDDRIRELEQQVGRGGTEPGGEISAAQLDRMEQLLAELEHGDERVARLEELLAAAEEAGQAEQEERRQLEAWLADIELRVTEQEQQWQAERDSLLRQLEQARELGSAVEQSESATDSAAVSAPQDAARNRQLEAEIQQLKTAAVDQNDEIERRVAEKVEAELRAHRLQMAQDHAQLARDRAELQRSRELEPVESTPAEVDVDNADQRIKVLRDHLRQIRDDEEQQRREHKLSHRLARLWARLEGR